MNSFVKSLLFAASMGLVQAGSDVSSQLTQEQILNREIERSNKAFSSWHQLTFSSQIGDSVSPLFNARATLSEFLCETKCSLVRLIRELKNCPEFQMSQSDIQKLVCYLSYYYDAAIAKHKEIISVYTPGFVCAHYLASGYSQDDIRGLISQAFSNEDEDKEKTDNDLIELHEQMVMLIELLTNRIFVSSKSLSIEAQGAYAA